MCSSLMQSYSCHACLHWHSVQSQEIFDVIFVFLHNWFLSSSSKSLLKFKTTLYSNIDLQMHTLYTYLKIFNLKDKAKIDIFRLA